MKTIPLPRKMRNLFQNQPVITWSFQGAFTIVLNEKRPEITAELLRGLEMGGFSIFKNYASCANILIEGVQDSSSYLIHGVVMDSVENFFSYDYIERIVTADGVILWEETKT